MLSKKGFLLLAFGLVITFSMSLVSGCRKQQFGNGQVSFSTDTLTFDTVFTSLGSITRSFKVFNTSSKAIRIADMRLMHLVGNQFRINVDGMTGDHFTDVEIPAKDSIYVFVEVTVDPNNVATPFVIIDDVSFLVNGDASIVHLQAFGQNAHFHYGEEISSGTVNWTNDLPHVVISKGSVPGVFVSCGADLSIGAGCKVFFAGNSAIFVEGHLSAKANSWTDSIVFQGARLESYYQDQPGQWFGIVFLRDTASGSCASSGLFEYCVVNESSYGIYAGAGLTNDLSKYQGSGGRPQLVINNTIVKNSQFNAVYGFNAEITATNSIFHTAGEHLMKFGLGGVYNFTHCTMFNGGSRFISHEKEALLLSNFVSDGVNAFPTPLQTTFANCVLYGSLENEISFNNYSDDPLMEFDVAFHYSDVKAKEDSFNMFTTNDNVLINQDPRFKNTTAADFTPWDSVGYFSPLIDKCSTVLSQDIFGNSRVLKPLGNPATPADMGAIEAQ
jgi:hypothetical protein